MSTAAFYREEAKRYRELAAASPGSEAAKHWLRFAADYDVLADLMEEEGGDTQSMAKRDPEEQQPMQQQTKQEPEDKD